jgi:hypothetical protein
MLRNKLSVHIASWENNSQKIWVCIITAASIIFAVQSGRLIVTDPGLVPLVFITLFILVVALWFPQLLVILLLIFVPVHPFARVLFLTDTQALWREVVISALTVALVAKLAVKKKWLAKSPLNLPVAVFVLVALVQLLRAPNLLQGVIGLRTHVLYLPVCLFIINNPFTERQTRAVAMSMMGWSLILALFGVYQRSLGLEGIRNLGWEARNLMVYGSATIVRTFSTFVDPSAFAFYLGFMIAMGTGILIHHQSGARANAYLGFVILTLVAALATTMMRAQWVIVAAGAAFTFTLVRNSRYIIFLIVGSVFTILLLQDPGISYRASQFRNLRQDDSIQGRILNVMTWNIPNLLAHPLGTGLGTTGSANYRYETFSGETNPADLVGGGGTENRYFTIGLQFGIPGLAVYIWLLVTLLTHGIRIYRRLSDPLLKGLAVGISVIIFQVIVGDVTGGALDATGPDLYFWFFVGLLFTLERVEKGKMGIMRPLTNGLRA